jgi:hypothetical protein
MSWAAQKRKKYQREWLDRRKYGLKPGDREKILTLQGGSCAICASTAPKAKNWHIDHSHQTGTVRGILCNRCNVMLGMAKDDPGVLAAGILYLRAHSVEN